MPRPSINLEPFQAEISNLYQTGTNPRTIANIISNRYGIKVGERTIKTRLSIWGIQKSNRTASRDTVLHARIKVLIYQVGLSDEEILHTLKLEGYDITPRSLKYIRHQKGFLRRLANPVADQAQVENVLNQLRTDLATGQIEGYGIRFLHQHFKNQGFLIGRYVIFTIIYICRLADLVRGTDYSQCISSLPQLLYIDAYKTYNAIAERISPLDLTLSGQLMATSSLPHMVLKYMQQLMHTPVILYGFMLVLALVQQLVYFGSSLIPLLLLNSSLVLYDQTVELRQSYWLRPSTSFSNLFIQRLILKIATYMVQALLINELRHGGFN